MAVANLYVTGDQSTAASMIANLNGEDFTDNAKTLYDSLSGQVKSSLFTQYYTSGTTAYSNGDYKTAATELAKAVENDPDRANADHYNALLYLGMAYYYQGDTSNADKIFNQIVKYYPDMASNVQGYITSSGGAVDADAAAADLSGLGDGANGTGEADTSGGNADGGDGSGDITVYGDNVYAAWTDPTTGKQYDVNGNLLPGQE